MRKRSEKTPFEAYSKPPPDAPKGLKLAGRALWAKIHREFVIYDAAGQEMLRQACAAADRAEECRLQVDREGLTVRMSGGGMRDHPLLRHEETARFFIVKTLHQLGLEPVQGVGRPSGVDFTVGSKDEECSEWAFERQESQRWQGRGELQLGAHRRRGSTPRAWRCSRSACG